MAIIYSYPTVTPTSDDLVLGTDVNGEGKPTKNFTIQSIVDIVQGGATGLGAVLTISSDALQQPATNFTNVQGTGAAQPNITSLGSLTGLVINGAVSGTNVITSTSLTGASNTNIASTLAIKTYVDSNPSGAESLAATLLIGNTTSGRDIAVSAGDDITFTNTSKILMGTTAVDNLEIYSDSANSIIIDRSPGALKLQTSLLSVRNEADTTQTISASAAGAVELYYGGTKKFETTSSGVKTDGIVENPAGTSGAPTFTFTGDTNTGMYRSGAGFVAFSSNGNITARISESDFESESTDFTVNGVFRAFSTAQASFGGKLTVATPTASSDAATKGYVDLNNAGQTLDYAGDATGPFALNLSTDDLEFNGDSNITVTAAAVAATKGIVTIDLNNDIGISGTMTAGTFTDGTFSGTAGTYTGGVSITSSTFTATNTPIGFIGNATTATALATAGTIQLLSGSGATQGVASNAVTYTSGGNVQLTTTLADTTVTAKALTNLPTPTSAAIDANDTILAAMAKLQGQITSTTGLSYEGTWDARNSAEGGSSDGGNPDLTQASTKVNGHFYIVNTPGNAEPNGGSGTQLSPWANGDWVIYVASSGTTEWQKLDQSNEVLGSGAATKLALWTSTNTLGTGLISDDGATVTIGTNGNLVVQGNTTLGDNAALDTVTLNGPTTFESTGRFKKGIALGTATDGSEYGATGQVLTASTSAGSPPTWTTPTTGVVESITGNYGITIGGTAAIPTVAVTADANNLINQATAKATPVGADTILINDSAASNVLKKATLTSIKTFTAESWLLDVDGGTAATISDGDQVGFNSGTGIVQTLSTKDITTAIDYVGNNNAIEAAADGTSITVAATDKLWVSDADDNTIKQINVSQVSGVVDQNLAEVLAVNNVTGGTDIAVSANDDITLTNSSKIKWDFGGGLELFSTSSTDNVISTGTSANLYVKSDILALQKSNGDSMLSHGGQAVSISYRGSTNPGVRFLTTTTGIEVFNADVNGAPTILLNQDSNNFTITQAVSGAGQIINSFGSLSLRNDGSINLQNNAGTYTKASFDSSISFSPDNLAGTATVPGVTIYQSTDATADGTRTRVYGNLQVDGNIIHADAGNSGTYNFDDTVNASSNENIFSITGGDGACAFTVYFTCNTASYSVAKVYTVVHSYGTTVVYNKLVDSGPYGGHDFTPTFTGATNVLTCNIANGSGSISANISTTVILGASPQNLTVAAL
ncbi:MAG: beta strand repeat-containing protein [Candidatus Kariarchaeaceae archaeon]|jgi:hypothetical protein